jgi:type II secretory pathway pseudopilin PulG
MGFVGRPSGRLDADSVGLKADPQSSPSPHASRRSPQSGFTYLGALFLIALLGIMAAGAATLWSTEARRAKEVELLWVGDQYRHALKSYFEATQGPAKLYPKQLEDLLEDKRGLIAKRHLRRLYRDPMAGDDLWGLLKDKDGGIVGVFSLSEAVPLKIDGFAAIDKSFKDARRYADWRFLADDKVAVASASSSTGEPLEAGAKADASGSSTPDGSGQQDGTPDAQPEPKPRGQIIPNVPLPRLPANPTTQQVKQYACDLGRRNGMPSCYGPLNSAGEEVALACVAAIEATHQSCLAAI